MISLTSHMAMGSSYQPSWYRKRSPRNTIETWLWLLLGVWCCPWGTAYADVPVSVQPLEELVFYPEFSAPASVLSLNQSRLSFEVEGRLSELPVKVGMVVDPGGILARVDRNDYRLDLRHAEADLDGLKARRTLAEAQLGRVKVLRKKHSASIELLNQRQTELESVRAEIEAQQSLVARARRDLERCSLKAPFRALVLERLAHLGEFVSRGAPVLKVLDVDAIEVSAKIQVQDVPSLLARAESAAFVTQGRRFPVELRVVVPAMDPRERTQEARLVFPDQKALPGAVGRLVWSAMQPHLPPFLLVRRGDQIGVFIAKDQTAVFVPLPNAEQGRPVPVDLPAGTLIVIEGRFGLDDGVQLIVH